MIQEKGVVVEIRDSSAWVETQRKSACDSCSANKGCGTAVMSKAFGKKRNLVEVENSLNANVGDKVLLGLEEAALVKGSFSVYIVPLLLMMGLALVGELLGNYVMNIDGEWLTILFAVLGVIAGAYWLRAFSKRNRCNGSFHPVMIRKETEPLH